MEALMENSITDMIDRVRDVGAEFAVLIIRTANLVDKGFLTRKDVETCVTTEDLSAIFYGQLYGYAINPKYAGIYQNVAEMFTQNIEAIRQIVIDNMCAKPDYSNMIALDAGGKASFGAVNTQLGKSGSIASMLYNKYTAQEKRKGSAASWHSPTVSDSTIGVHNKATNFRNVNTFMLGSTFRKVYSRISYFFAELEMIRKNHGSEHPELTEQQKDNFVAEYILNGSLAFKAKYGPIVGESTTDEDTGLSKASNSGVEFFLISDGTIKGEPDHDGDVRIYGKHKALEQLIDDFNAANGTSYSYNMISDDGINKTSAIYLGPNDSAVTNTFINGLSNGDVKTSVAIPYTDETAAMHAEGKDISTSTQMHGSTTRTQDSEFGLEDVISKHQDRNGGSDDQSHIRLDRAYYMLCRQFSMNSAGWNEWITNHLISPVNNSSMDAAEKAKALQTINGYLGMDFYSMNNGEAVMSRIAAPIVKNMCDEINAKNIPGISVDCEIKKINGYAFTDYTVHAKATNKSLVDSGLLAVYKKAVIKNRTTQPKYKATDLIDRFVGSPTYGKALKAHENTFLRDFIEYNDAVAEIYGTQLPQYVIDDVANEKDSAGIMKALMPSFSVNELLQWATPTDGDVASGGNIDLYRAFFIKTLPNKLNSIPLRKAFCIRLGMHVSTQQEVNSIFMNLLKNLEAEDIPEVKETAAELASHGDNITRAFHTHASAEFFHDSDEGNTVESEEKYSSLNDFEDAYLPIIHDFDPSVKPTESTREQGGVGSFLNLIDNTMNANGKFADYYNAITSPDVDAKNGDERTELAKYARPFRHIPGIRFNFVDADGDISYRELPPDVKQAKARPRKAMAAATAHLRKPAATAQAAPASATPAAQAAPAAAPAKPAAGKFDDIEL